MTAFQLYRTLAQPLAPLCASAAEGAQATDLWQDRRRGTAAARTLAAQGLRACRSDGRRAVTMAISSQSIEFDSTEFKANAS
jgi:hypothetical protein